MALVISIAIVCVFAYAILSVTKEVGFYWNPTALIKSLMQMARIMFIQLGKRRKGQAGKGDVQFGQDWFVRVISIMVASMK